MQQCHKILGLPFKSSDGLKSGEGGEKTLNLKMLNNTATTEGYRHKVLKWPKLKQRF